MNKKYNLYFRIYSYATTATEDAVFIIGGYTSRRSSTIAKYSDDTWTNVGTLKKGRENHQAITIKGKTFIIGGWHENSGSM